MGIVSCAKSLQHLLYCMFCLFVCACMCVCSVCACVMCVCVCSVRTCACVWCSCKYTYVINVLYRFLAHSWLKIYLMCLKQ